jgi:hypothetical protein
MDYPDFGLVNLSCLSTYRVYQRTCRKGLEAWNHLVADPESGPGKGVSVQFNEGGIPALELGVHVLLAGPLRLDSGQELVIGLFEAKGRVPFIALSQGGTSHLDLPGDRAGEPPLRGRTRYMPRRPGGHMTNYIVFLLSKLHSTLGNNLSQENILIYQVDVVIPQRH